MLADYVNGCSQRPRTEARCQVLKTMVLGALILAQMVQGTAAEKVSVPNPLEADVDLEAKLSALKDSELRLAQRLVELAPDHEEPLVIKGNVFSRRGMTDQAIACWDRALHKNPQRLDIYHKLAQVAVEMDQLDRAISLWRKTTELDPTTHGVHIKIAEALVKQGKHKQGIAEIQKEIEVSGELSVDASFLLGQAFRHLREYEKAQASLKRALALNPEHMDAHYNLSRVYAGMKRMDEAKQHLAEFQRLKAAHLEAGRRADAALPSDIDCFYQSLAKFCFDVRRFHLNTGKDPKTSEVLKDAMALGQTSIAFFERLAELYAANQQAPEALALYYQTTQLDPNHVSGHLNMGLLSVKLGLNSQAEQLFKKTISLAPDEPAGYQELTRLYLRTKKNLPEARGLAQRAVTLSPSAEAFHDLGLACFVNQDLPAALTAMRRAMELDPRNPRYKEAYRLIQQKQEASQ